MKDTDATFENEGYLLEELLASDQWGDLHRGTYVSHNRPVLLRRFAPALAAEGPWRLAAAEIQAWARVDHPGVIQPLDWGNPTAGPYLATEMPAGAPLASLITAEDGLAGIEPEQVFAGVVEAVEAARLWGVLHLGLGPTNVWVAPDGSVRVSEFGIWYVQAEFGEPGAAGGPFLAPEQVSRSRVGASADVYSLAMLLVALRRGLDAAELARGGQLPPSTADVSSGEAAALRRCLESNPLARPRSAGEMAEAMGLTAPAEEDNHFRDCPVCRLKEEIARERREEPGTVAERLRAFSESTGQYPSPQPSPPRGEGETWRPPRTTGEGETRLPSTPVTITKMFPWIVIAALAMATLTVWWLAFR